jgi:hypothetical protein
MHGSGVLTLPGAVALIIKKEKERTYYCPEQDQQHATSRDGFDSCKTEEYQEDGEIGTYSNFFHNAVLNHHYLNTSYPGNRLNLISFVSDAYDIHQY